MMLKQGETIFDKMGIPYDTLRKMDNPVAPVSKYYTEHSRPGESLWWAQGEVESTTSSATIRLWTSLDKEEKEQLTAHGYALFPEIIGPASSKKYNRYALWLASSQGVVNTNVRDSFSAGGKISMALTNHINILMPASFARIKRYRELIRRVINEASPLTLEQYWEVGHVENNRVEQWCNLVIHNTAQKMKYAASDILSTIFSEYAPVKRYKAPIASLNKFAVAEKQSTMPKSTDETPHNNVGQRDKTNSDL